MKKFLALFFALVLVISMVACDTTPEDPTETETDTETETETETEAETNAPDPFEGLDVMSYEEYIAAEKDDAVIIEAYVQATQSWWDNKITAYLQDEDGAYFAYEMACSEADAAKLTAGTKIHVKGYKGEWAGEIEIVDATFTFVDGADDYVADPADLTDILADEAELLKHQNELAIFKGLTVEKIEYKNGEPGDDIYVTVKQGDETFDFCVERYLTGPETDVYKAFADIEAGDVVNITGFVYWYNGVNTHITDVQTVMTHDEYVAAEADAPVMIEAYIQGAQKYSEQYGNTTLYLQDENGGYFVYRYACTADQYAKLTVGTKVRVEGYKSEWSGEIEIVDATVTVIEGATPYIADAADLTNILANEVELLKHQNELAIFKGLTIENIEYKNGEPGNDIYVTVKQGENSFDFCVESDLIDPETDVYKAFATLNAGDKVDITGFIYWYNGVNTHITGVTAAE